MFQRIINFFKRIFSRKKVIAPQPSTPETPEPLPSPPGQNNGSEVPANGLVQVGDIIAINEEERQMCIGAIVHVRDIIASPFFKEEVLSSKFTSTDGMTNEEIYKKYTDSKLTVNVHMFYGSYYQNHISHTVGYDTPEDDYVNANRYYVQDSATLASLIMHELAHALGFHHINKNEDTSVPYMMNKISESVMKKMGISN